MRIFAFVLLLLAWAPPLAAQNAKIDELNRLLAQATTDTARVNLNVRKAAELVPVQLDSALVLATRTAAFARRVGYPTGEANAWAQAARASALKGNYADARQALHRAEGLVSPEKSPDTYARIYSNYGVLYFRQSRLDSAAAFFQKAVPYARQTGNRDVLVAAYMNLGSVCRQQNDYRQALAYYQQARPFVEQQNDPKRLAGLHLLTSGVLLLTGDTARAERAALDAVRFARRSGSRYEELHAHAGLASVIGAKRRYDQAYRHYLRASALARESGDPGTQATNLMSAAWMLAQQKKYPQAEALNRRAMALADSLRQPRSVYDVYATMGSIFTEQGKYAAALPFYERAFAAVGNTLKPDEKLRIVHANLALCYEKTGQYPRALAAFRRSAAIADSVRNQENIRKATELSLNYEFNQKQAVAHARQQVAEAESRRRQRALGVGLAVTVVLMVLAFLGYRTKQRDNALLEAQTAQIQQTLTELRATQAQLIQSEKMASLGELTAGIAHEIQNPLNFVNNFSEVSTELVDELQEQLANGDAAEASLIAGDLRQNLEKIAHHGQRAGGIVRGMLEHSRASTGQKEPTDLNALADEYLRLSYHGLRAKDKAFNAALNTDFDPALGLVEVVPQDLGRMLLNLLNNAFHAVAERKKQQPDGYQPTVTVTTKRHPNEVEIQVVDNGVGIAEGVVQKIFQPFFTTKPTGEGTGLGLSLSYDIVTKGHGGTLEVESIAGEGTAFVVRLPAR